MSWKCLLGHFDLLVCLLPRRYCHLTLPYPPASSLLVSDEYSVQDNPYYFHGRNLRSFQHHCPRYSCKLILTSGTSQIFAIPKRCLWSLFNLRILRSFDSLHWSRRRFNLLGPSLPLSSEKRRNQPALSFQSLYQILQNSKHRCCS